MQFRRSRTPFVTSILSILFAVALAVATLVGCTPSSVQDPPTTTPTAVQAVEPSAVKGWRLSTARLTLEADGWTVAANSTKKRPIKPGDGVGWQVVKVRVGDGRTITLTAGKLTTKTVRIPFKSKTVKTSEELASYREVVQPGEHGQRVITYLDGKKITSEVTEKPTTRVIRIGTRRPYTGRCTIWGSYQHRYVRCTGYYNPAAKRDAKELANLCNSTSRPLAACRGVYGTYFY